jgi:Cu(I)/Ag(I) efflux system membrane fusion protein
VRLHRTPAAFAALALSLACGRSAEPAHVTAPGLALAATVSPAVPRIGANEIALRLADGAGAPVEGAHLELSVAMPAMGSMPAMGGAVPVRERGDGRYDARFDLTMAGSWRVTIAAHAPGGAALAAEGALVVGTPGLRIAASPGATGAPGATGGTEHGAHAPEAGAPPAEEGDAALVAIAPARAAEIGVRSVPARRMERARTARALGTVGYDETAVTDVSLKVRGWIGAVQVGPPGAEVARGDALFTLYSPELYAAQQELLQAAGSGGGEARGGPDGATRGSASWRAQAARKRLALWDVAPAEIDAILRAGAPREELPIRAPAAGVVVERNVVAGSATQPGERIVRIASLERVWVEAEVYESDAALAAPGVAAELDVAALPGRTFAGRVASVLPALSEAARTLRVRLVLENPDRALRPGMWASVRLRGATEERLVVPDGAVLHAGERSVVFVDEGGGRYRPRRVELGATGDGQVEVLRGLLEGERVVSAGTFLIAAESRLRAGREPW